MATKPKSYRKGDYIYTESSPGSNRYQNFTAAKPTVKKVRDDSRKDKAVVVTKKVSTSKPGESKMATTEATRKPSRGQEKRYPSAEDRKMATVGQEQRYRPAPKSSAPFSKGKGSPSVPPRGQEQRYPGRSIDKIRRLMGMYPTQRSVMIK